MLYFSGAGKVALNDARSRREGDIMRIKLFIPAMLVLLLLPFAARAITQEKIDNLIFLLNQPGWDKWGEGVFDETTLYEGFTTIYQQAVDDGDDALLRKVMWAMGETTMGAFEAELIASIDDEPIVACYALGKIPSEAGVYALIGKLDDEDMHIRDAAAWGLGSMPYDTSLVDARDDALAALQAHLEAEEEDWVREDIQAAIDMIETGIATSAAFEENERE